MTRFASQLRPQLSRFARFTGLAYLAGLARARHARMARSIRMAPQLLLHQLAHLPRQLPHHALHVVAIAALILSMGGTWMLAKDANAAPGQTPTAVAASSSSAVTSTKQAPLSDDDLVRPRPAKKDVTGKINLNTATEDQLMLLPTVGPSKAERVVTWRKKNGGFKRTADLRRVKGFGYKTFKRLEPFLDIKGDTTLAPRR